MTGGSRSQTKKQAQENMKKVVDKDMDDLHIQPSSAVNIVH